MPRIPIDYSKTIIYRIVCKDPTIKDCYVGSTTDFKSRKSHHNINCNNITRKYSNLKVYQFIRDKGGFKNWDMIEVEKYNAIDKLDQRKRERYWLEYYNATLNIQVPSRTKREWTEDHKVDLLVKSKIYYEEHKYEILDYAKKYREEHKYERLDYAKKYSEENKDKLAEYKKIYHQEHRDELNRGRKERHHRKKEQRLMGLEDICV